MQVRLGEYNIDVREDSEVVRSPSVIIRHPNYSSRTLNNDIMLIKLASAVDYSADVQPIALPTSCAEAGTECLISGWGNTLSSGSEYLHTPHVAFTLLLLYHHARETHVQFTPSLQPFLVVPASPPRCPDFTLPCQCVSIYNALHCFTLPCSAGWLSHIGHWSF